MVNDQPWVCCCAAFVFVCGKVSHSQCQVLVEPGNLTPDLCIVDGMKFKVPLREWHGVIDKHRATGNVCSFAP